MLGIQNKSTSYISKGSCKLCFLPSSSFKTHCWVSLNHICCCDTCISKTRGAMAEGQVTRYNQSRTCISYVDSWWCQDLKVNPTGKTRINAKFDTYHFSMYSTILSSFFKNIVFEGSVWGVMCHISTVAYLTYCES